MDVDNVGDIAEKLCDEGKLKEALALLKQGLRYDSQNLKLLNLLTYCLIRNGQLTEARSVLQAAKSIKEHDAAILWTEVRLLVVTGDKSTAVELAKISNKRYPNDVEGMILLSACLRDENSLADSGWWIDKALSLEPNNAEALLNKGLNELKVGRRSKAITALEMAHEIKPNLKKYGNY